MLEMTYIATAKAVRTRINSETLENIGF